MFGSLGEALGAKAGAFESKLVLYIIIGVAAIVIVNLLLDGVRKFIRGLDTAALGALLIFLGYKASEVKLVSVLSHLLYLIGGTLLVLGILIFVIMRLIKSKRKAKRSGPPMPKETAEKEKQPEVPKSMEPQAESQDKPSADA